MVSQKIGFLFPGQGAQYVGMGKDMADQFEEVRKVYSEADTILGYPISKNCFEGPEDRLTRTLYSQPAIYTTSLALFALLIKRLPEVKPSLVAGLSLGEFSALSAAKVFSFPEGLKLVHNRAESMEKAAQENPGTMASVLGLNQEQCEVLAKESGAQVANLNAPDQFVLSGTEAAIGKSIQLAEGYGAKRAIKLKVGGAFHSPLMEPAKKRFTKSLKSTSFRKPACMFIPNVTAESQNNPETIRELLARQLTSPVQWSATMHYAKKQGITRFVEIGPGRVLKGLAKRIDPSLEVLSFEKIADLQVLESAFAGV